MCDLTFKHPFTCLIAGPSGSGKTHLVRELLASRRSLMSPPPAAVYYYYNTWQDVYNSMEDEGLVSEFIRGTPTSAQFGEKAGILQSRGGSLFIIDDAINNETTDLGEIFTVLSHHRNASVVFITQNLFLQNKEFRTVSLNTHYIFVMKSPRDMLQLRSFAKQMYPGDSAFAMSSYKSATKHPFSYILFDASQKTRNQLRVRSRIFPSQQPMHVFISKKEDDFRMD
jgi:energy-coupling factor transporter ATP-binding protein EcfA2